MTAVLRPLDPETEKGRYMPQRELLEPEASEVTLAVAQYVAQRVAEGAKDERGLVLVQLDDGTQAESFYSVFIR